MLTLVAAGVSGCVGGSSSSSTTPKGNYTVTVTATSGSLTHMAIAGGHHLLEVS
jgi:hypothetical protein